MGEPNLKERIIHFQLINPQIELINGREIRKSVVNFIDIVIKLTLMCV